MWKLALVIKGQASEKLLDSYAHDRQFAADENIMNSTRSTDFITPKSRTSKTFRNQVLALAKHHPFARKLVNSGRLSVPSFLTGSVLNTPDADVFEGNMVPGAPMDDAPVQLNGQDAWLLNQVGKGFQVMLFVDAPLSPDVLAQLADVSWHGGSTPLRANAQLADVPLHGGSTPLRANAQLADVSLHGGSTPLRAIAPPIKPTLLIVAPSPLDIPGMNVIVDPQGLVAKRYDAQPGTTYLLRPDQHVLARWRTLNTERLQAAMARALGQVGAPA
jgi:3-(3-hydroxy-phenyl)propionate hydroxylase